MIRILLLLLLPSLTFAQRSQIDQLELLKEKTRKSTVYDSIAVFNNGSQAIQLATKLKEQDVTGFVYQYYGNFYYYNGNLKKAREFYQKALSIAATSGNNELKYTTLIRLNYFNFEKDIRSTEKEFLRILAIAEKEQLHKVEIEACNGLGIVNEQRSLTEIAVHYYLKALKIAQRFDFQFEKAYLLNNLGLIKLESGFHQEARNNFEKALVIALENDEKRLEMNLKNNLGLIYNRMGNHRTAIQFYKENLTNTKKSGFSETISANFINISSLYVTLNVLDSAGLYLDSAFIHLNGSFYSTNMNKVTLLRADIAKRKHQLKAAKVLLYSILEGGNVTKNLEIEKEANKMLAEIAEQEHDYKSSLMYVKKYNAIKDTILNSANKVKISQLEMAYAQNQLTGELNQEKSKYNLLKKEKELEGAKVRNWVLVYLVIFIFITTLVLWFNFVSKRKSQRKYTQDLIQNLDEERLRIAKDLHDDIGQMLAVVKSKINLFTSGRIENIDSLSLEIAQIISQTRKIAHELHSSNIEKLGLEKSLISLLEKTELNTTMICSLEITDAIEEHFSIAEKNEMYRIIQECINNTIKYSQASAFKVAFVETNHEIEMVVRDNGNGATSVSKDGIGLKTIAERAERIKSKALIQLNENGFKLSMKFKKNES